MSGPLRVGIVGGVAHDTFAHLPDAAAEKIFWVARQSLASPLASLDPDQVPPPALASPCQRAMVLADLAGSLISTIERHASELDLLLIDLFDERYGLVRTRDQALLTSSDELRRCGLLEEVGVAQALRLGSPEHLDLFRQGLDLLVKTLTQTGLRDRTLLLAPAFAEDLLPGAEVDPADVHRLRREAQEFNRLYPDYLAEVEYRGISVLRLGIDTVRMDPGHPGGLSILHYQDATYQALLEAIRNKASAFVDGPLLRQTALVNTAQDVFLDPAEEEPFVVGDEPPRSDLDTTDDQPGDDPHRPGLPQPLEPGPEEPELEARTGPRSDRPAETEQPRALVLLLHRSGSVPSIGPEDLPAWVRIESCEVAEQDPETTPEPASRLRELLTESRLAPHQAVVVASEAMAVTAVVTASGVPQTSVVVLPEAEDHHAMGHRLGHVVAALQVRPQLPSLLIFTRRRSPFLQILWWLISLYEDLSAQAQLGTVSIEVVDQEREPDRQRALAAVTRLLGQAPPPDEMLDGASLRRPEQLDVLDRQTQWVLLPPDIRHVRVTVVTSEASPAATVRVVAATAQAQSGADTLGRNALAHEVDVPEGGGSCQTTISSSGAVLLRAVGLSRTDAAQPLAVDRVDVEPLT